MDTTMGHNHHDEHLDLKLWASYLAYAPSYTGGLRVTSLQDPHPDPVYGGSHDDVVTTQAAGNGLDPKIFNNVNFTVGEHYDFNMGNTPTAVGFSGVRGGDLYTPDRGNGWLAAAPEFDRGTPDALLRDGQWGRNNSYRVDLSNGDYV